VKFLDTINYKRSTTMVGLLRKNFDSPEDTRPFEKDTGKLDLVNIAGGPIWRSHFGCQYGIRSVSFSI